MRCGHVAGAKLLLMKINRLEQQLLQMVLESLQSNAAEVDDVNASQEYNSAEGARLKPV
jgi:hypothetical protein